MTREILPGRRRSETIHLEVVNASFQAFRYSVTVGYYDAEMTRIGEVFINSDKITTDLDVAARDVAILLSFALQHGVDPRTIQRSLTRDVDGRPLGLLGTLLDKLYLQKEDPNVES
jgi:hypothetical protein